MQRDMISGAVDRALGMLITWALTYVAAKGYIAQSSIAELTPALVVLIWAAYGAWVNRPKALVQAAANVPGTVVLTTRELSEATPNQENIIPTGASPKKIASVVASTAGA